jgi:hypothetical protein
MYVSVWGQNQWDTLMLTALAYSKTPTKEAQAEMLELLRLTFRFLPCTECAIHATLYFDTDGREFDVSSGDALFASLVHFHNIVNKRTGKAHMNTADAKQALVDRHVGSDIQLLSRSDQRRLEDHARISKLHGRLASMRVLLNEHAIDIPSDDVALNRILDDITLSSERALTSAHWKWVITSVILAMIIVILVVFLIVLGIRRRSADI